MRNTMNHKETATKRRLPLRLHGTHISLGVIGNTKCRWLGLDRAWACVLFFISPRALSSFAPSSEGKPCVFDVFLQRVFFFFNFRYDIFCFPPSVFRSPFAASQSSASLRTSVFLVIDTSTLG